MTTDAGSEEGVEEEGVDAGSAEPGGNAAPENQLEDGFDREGAGGGPRAFCGRAVSLNASPRSVSS